MSMGDEGDDESLTKAIEGLAEDWSSDELLTWFARLAQESDYRFRVTLFVKGAVIQGEVISRDRWLAEMAKLTSHYPKAADLGGHLEERLHDMDLHERGEKILRFLHLRDTTILHDGRLSPKPGLLWRGRITQVDGWTLGAFNGQQGVRVPGVEAQPETHESAPADP